MSRLSVSSSNSLRRSSPSARKRAQSLGRLGELAEDESYQYEQLNHHGDKVNGGSTYWQDRIRQVRSNGFKPNEALQRAKSICEVGTLSEATPPTPVSPQRTGVTGYQGGQYARSEGAGLKQRPASCHYNLQTVETNSRAHLRLKPAASHLPDLLSSSRETPRRPCSSYDIKVT